MSLEISGKVKLLMDKQTFASGFEKREFVITTQEQYPQDIKFECIKEKMGMIENLKPGDMVKVAFNLRGNEYKGNYYNNLQAWKVELENTTNAEGANQKSSSIPNAPMPTEPPMIDESDNNFDDLPF